MDAISRDKYMEEIITAYKQMVYDRYDYEAATHYYKFPASVDEDKLYELRAYFMSHIYPPYQRRMQLNDAFDSLGNFITQPAKLIQIIMTSGSLILKYGRHIPGMLSTALTALNTFRMASKFEQKLVEEAVRENHAVPISTEELQNLIKTLDKKEMDQFIDGVETLFELIYDDKQVKKISDILQFIYKKMNSRPALYSDNEREAIKVALTMMAEGSKIFLRMPETDRELFVTTIIKIERDKLDEIFSGKE